MTGGNGTGLYQWNGGKWIYLIAPSDGPGATGEVLTAKGAGNAPVWATATGGGCNPKMEVFTSSGTWTRPADVDMV